MIKLSTLILEDKESPKAIVMAGGAGSGKTYLLNQLSLDSLTQFNPDKYVEDKNHPYYNKLGPASNQTAKMQWQQQKKAKPLFGIQLLLELVFKKT